MSTAAPSAKLIVELAGAGAADFYDELSRAGFRRSQGFAYRRPAANAWPACRYGSRSSASCTAARPAGCANLNRALVRQADRRPRHPEQYQLFHRLPSRSRHRDSDMATMSYADYRSMVEDTPLRTVVAEFRDADGRWSRRRCSTGSMTACRRSTVFTIPPTRGAASAPGAFSGWSRSAAGRPVACPISATGSAESPKMAYKARFPAVERLSAAGWVPLSAPSGCMTRGT